MVFAALRQCTYMVSSLTTSSIDLVCTCPQVEPVTDCISCICGGSAASIEKHQRHLWRSLVLSLCLAFAFAFSRVLWPIWTRSVWSRLLFALVFCTLTHQRLKQMNHLWFVHAIFKDKVQRPTVDRGLNTVPCGVGKLFEELLVGFKHLAK